MTENGNDSSKKRKPLSKLSFRSLKLSLKYRPEIIKLILKMRQCIRKQNSLVKSLKQRLSQLETKTKSTSESTHSNTESTTINKTTQDSIQVVEKDTLSSETAVDKHTNKSEESLNLTEENTGWNLKGGGDTEKSIAEQVKEAAQSALQDTGMVYVESAGMYYDYKTGYYYNSELGLYYHTDTGCYYHYSADKQFVFHSYPDMSKVNASLIAHLNKKARKLKRGRKPEDDIDNLTKHLSQDTEDGGKAKKARKNKKRRKKKSKKPEEDIMDITENNIEIEKETIKMDSKNSDEKSVDLAENENQEDITESKNTDVDIFETNDENTEAESKDAAKLSVKGNKLKGDENEGDIQEIKDGDKIEMEDGECSNTDTENGSNSDASTSTVSDEDPIAKHHPPCMRVIVRETKLAKLKVGSLFLVTKDGGSVGREGEHHAVLLRDHNVSRNHLDIKYDLARKTYFAIDLGSKNGTILNGVRMSDSQEVSLPIDVVHGSTLQLGETKLLCHIHPGHTTCGQCEPGLLIQVEEEKKVKAYTRTVSVKKQHELELARLKNIYAPQHLAIEERPYTDRAQARREAVGSTNHAEKTQAVDLDTSIAADNKGFKLLQKMGWSKGEGLGKDNQGDTEPVPLISNEGKAGLGTVGAVAPPSNTPKPRVIKNNIASGTMRLAARTNMLRPPAKAFQNYDDDDEEAE